VSSVEGAKVKKGTSPEASQKQDLLAEIKGIKSELSSLKQRLRNRCPRVMHPSSQDIHGVAPSVEEKTMEILADIVLIAVGLDI
jgi:hypothetical protein